MSSLFFINFVTMSVSDIATERVPFNWMQFITIISFVISLTIGGTRIFYEFEAGNAERTQMKTDAAKEYLLIYQKIEEVNARLDKKTGRNSKAIEAFTGEPIKD